MKATTNLRLETHLPVPVKCPRLYGAVKKQIARYSGIKDRIYSLPALPTEPLTKRHLPLACGTVVIPRFQGKIVSLLLGIWDAEHKKPFAVVVDDRFRIQQIEVRAPPALFRGTLFRGEVIADDPHGIVLIIHELVALRGRPYHEPDLVRRHGEIVHLCGFLTSLVEDVRFRAGECLAVPALQSKWRKNGPYPSLWLQTTPTKPTLVWQPEPMIELMMDQQRTYFCWEGTRRRELRHALPDIIFHMDGFHGLTISEDETIVQVRVRTKMDGSVLLTFLQVSRGSTQPSSKMVIQTEIKAAQDHIRIEDLVLAPKNMESPSSRRRRRRRQK